MREQNEKSIRLAARAASETFAHVLQQSLLNDAQPTARWLLHFSASAQGKVVAQPLTEGARAGTAKDLAKLIETGDWRMSRSELDALIAACTSAAELF